MLKRHCTLIPYCTGAAMPAGKVPEVTWPQGHLFLSALCSVTSRKRGGMSNTCRLSCPSGSVSIRSLPQWAHVDALLNTVRVGSSTISSVFPLCPFWPPRFFPVFFLMFLMGTNDLLGGI